jgi:cell division protein FtsQ
MSTTARRDDRSPAGAERRRELRRQRRRDLLRNLWRVLVLSGVASGLGWLLLREGWVLRNPSQIEVIGSRDVSREQVISEAQLRFPLQLLTLRPQLLAQRLSAGLPVENVRISRLMLPPRLRIELADRKAVARAQRRSGARLEDGYVDRLGNWMTRRQHRESGSVPSVVVLGWQERLRPALALILERSQRLGSPLTQVRFEPDGSVWLRTVALGQVHLGPVDARLPRRLEVLQHLSGELPRQIRALNVQSIDLSDPERPELGLPATPRPRPTAVTPTTAPPTAVTPSTGRRAVD